MLLARLLLSLVVAGWGVWAQDTEEKVQGIPLRTHSLSVVSTTPHDLILEVNRRRKKFVADIQMLRQALLRFGYAKQMIIRTDSYIRLTSDRPSRSGWLFSRVPLTATNWEIEVEFKIKGRGNLYGDGFAMWITKQRGVQGDVFGSVDKFEGLGIFFDTYKNNRPGTQFPYVMAMLGDGNTEYDKGNDGKANELSGCSARGIRNKDWPTKARLTYFQDQNLVLQLQFKTEGEWTPCFDVPNVKIPSVAYLGFSAETGELSDNHDIINVQTKNLYDASTRARAQDMGKQRGSKAKPTRKASNKSSGGASSWGSWGWFFLKIVLFFALCGGGYFGYTAYRSSKYGRRSSRF